MLFRNAWLKGPLRRFANFLRSQGAFLTGMSVTQMAAYLLSHWVCDICHKLSRSSWIKSICCCKLSNAPHIYWFIVACVTKAWAVTSDREFRLCAVNLSWAREVIPVAIPAIVASMAEIISITSPTALFSIFWNSLWIISSAGPAQSLTSTGTQSSEGVCMATA